MVDAVDSKSTDSNIMWVQVPSPVPLFLCYNIYGGNKMNTFFKNFLIVLFSIIIVCLIFLSYLMWNDKIDFGSKKVVLMYDNTFEETIENIEITTTSLDIKFVESENESTNVKIYEHEKSDI